MGQFGRLESLNDTPPEAQLVKMVKEAAALANRPHGGLQQIVPGSAEEQILTQWIDLIAAAQRLQLDEEGEDRRRDGQSPQRRRPRGRRLISLTCLQQNSQE